MFEVPLGFYQSLMAHEGKLQHERTCAFQSLRLRYGGANMIGASTSGLIKGNLIAS